MASETAYEQRLVVLQIGLGGVSGHLMDGGTVTFYDRRLAPYYGELVEGGYVLDKRAALEARPGLAVLSPMCKGNLAAGQRDLFQGAEGSIVAQAIASDTENPACGLARLALAAPQCGAFDDVAPDLFADWWRAHGARVGRRRGDVIVWEGGAAEAIRPFARRYLKGDGSPDYGD
jgi:hypothetical protein